YAQPHSPLPEMYLPCGSRSRSARMLSTTRNLFDALGGWGNRGRSARRFILVALVLWAGPAAAQSAAPPVHHTGWFHVMWGDAFGGAATARHVLIDQQG